MSNLLHNMSAPPRSEVKFEKSQIEKYIAFNPYKLAKLLGCQNILFEDFPNIVKEYVDNHPEITSIIKKPTGYMIAQAVPFLTSQNQFPKYLPNRKLNQYRYVECDDLSLLIVVLCSTVGDLYIPNRKLSFESTKFDKILFFLKEEVES